MGACTSNPKNINHTTPCATQLSARERAELSYIETKEPLGEPLTTLALIKNINSNINQLQIQRDRKLLDNATYENTPLEQYHFAVCKVLKVYDGDTYWVAGVVGNKCYRFNVRLMGVDCPEMKGGGEDSRDKARQAKQFVTDLMLNKIVGIKVVSNTKVDGKLIREKWGRLLAYIYVDGVNLSDELVKMGLAKHYFGGKK